MINYEINKKTNQIRYQQEVIINKNYLTIDDKVYSKIRINYNSVWVSFLITISLIVFFIWYSSCLIDSALNRAEFMRGDSFIVAWINIFGLDAPLGSLLNITLLFLSYQFIKKGLQLNVIFEDGTKAFIQTKNFYQFINLIKIMKHFESKKEWKLNAIIVRKLTNKIEEDTFPSKKTKIYTLVFLSFVIIYYLVMGIIALNIESFSNDGNNFMFVILAWLFVILFCVCFVLYQVRQISSWQVKDKEQSFSLLASDTKAYVIGMIIFLLIQAPFFFSWRELIMNIF